MAHLLLLAAVCAVASGLTPSTSSLRSSASRRASAARLALPDDDLPESQSLPDGELPDSLFGEEGSGELDMGLLKMPRITTPQRLAYDAFRKRQQDRKGPSVGDIGGIDDIDTSAPGPTYLGQDPVEGEPVDLTQFDERYRTEWEDPTEEAQEAALEDYKKAMGSSESKLPDDFGDLGDLDLGGK